MAQVNFRISDERLALIDRAAAIRGVTRTESVLRFSEAAAIETMNERPVILLDDEAWTAFTAALDAPVDLDLAVKQRYARRPQWDRQPLRRRSAPIATPCSSPRYARPQRLIERGVRLGQAPGTARAPTSPVRCAAGPSPSCVSRAAPTTARRTTRAG